MEYRKADWTREASELLGYDADDAQVEAMQSGIRYMRELEAEAHADDAMRTRLYNAGRKAGEEYATNCLLRDAVAQAHLASCTTCHRVTVACTCKKYALDKRRAPC